MYLVNVALGNECHTYGLKIALKESHQASAPAPLSLFHLNKPRWGNLLALWALWMGGWWQGRVLLLVLSVVLRLSMMRGTQGLLGTVAELLSGLSQCTSRGAV